MKYTRGCKMECFAAIRRADGKAYIDLLTIGALAKMARDKAEQTDKQMPGWAKDNPIVRVSRISIEEMSFHAESVVE